MLGPAVLAQRGAVTRHHSPEPGNTISCPDCGSDDVECFPKRRRSPHTHICYSCHKLDEFAT